MMKSSTTGQLREPNTTLRTRNAFRSSLLLLVTFLILFGLFAYLTQILDNAQSYVLLTTAIFSLLMCALAIRYSRQRKPEPAAYFMIASLLLFAAVTASVLSGVGLTLGISSLVMILMIATLTLIH